MAYFFDRFGTMIALAVFLVISCITIIGFEPTAAVLPTICAADDKGACFREWMSVSGSWFSGFATFATIIFLSRQIRSSERHHRQMVKIQFEKTYRLAMTTEQVAGNIADWCSQSLSQWSDARFGTYGEWDRAGVRHLKFLKDMFDRKDFAMVAEDIEQPKVQLFHLLESFKDTAAQIEEHQSRYSDAHVQYIREALTGNLRNAISYAEQTRDICHRHVQFVDGLSGH